MRAIPILLAIAVLAACAPRDRELRLARVAAERRNLDESLDRLEERLIVSQARVRLWRELRERHESVSAVACVSQEEHAQGMALHGLPGQQGWSLHRTRVAAASPGLAKPAVRSDAASR